jgi:hypothetical protein
MGFPWVSTQLRVGSGSIILLDGLGLIYFLYLGGCGMDIKVIIFGYEWEWVGFFAISRPTPVSSPLLDLCLLSITNKS